MNLEEMKAITEGLLFVTGDEGLELKQLADVLQVEPEVAKDVLYDLMEDYKDSSRGLSIVETENIFKFTTKKEHALYYKRLVETPTANKLSQAALETLAIIAYRQPITRVEIEEVRGVKTERPLQTLLAKSLIKEVGRSDSPGRAILYGTTNEFLDYFGLKSLKELPPLPDNLEDDVKQEEADLFFEKFHETMEEK